MKMRQVFMSFRWKRLKEFASYRSLHTMEIVTTAQGKLRGQTQELPDGGSYTSFKGIPYAKPPLGLLRFKAPLAPEPWDGIREATNHGGYCPQMEMTKGAILEGDENCLFLNVYSKNAAPSSKLAPVIFWIHGGAFISGSGDSEIYGPEYLLQHNVVVVTINYRLEVLGFLCLDNEQVPGNAGLKDQVAALKWVKQNISQFGGDPNNITLYGESAGACSVTYHMTSPMSRGLFQKVISHSGVSLCDWSNSTNARDRAFRLGRLLGKDTSDPDDLLTFLQGVPATDLVKVTNATMTEDEKMRGLPIHFCPVIEKRFPGCDCFVNDHQLDLLRHNKIEHVPLLIGYNNAEGILCVRDTLKKRDFVNNNFHCKIPREVYQKITNSKSAVLAEQIKQFYFKGDFVSKETIAQTCDLESDLLFIYNIHRFADLYSAVNTRPVYMFIFSCDTELNLMKSTTGLNNTIQGANHADDLFYIFRTAMTSNIVNCDENLKKSVYRITKMWTDFAKTGNPTPDGGLGVEWPVYDAKSKALLRIDEELQVGKPLQERLDFWNKLYEQSYCIAAKSNL